jgi:hypothetical protein
MLTQIFTGKPLVPGNHNTEDLALHAPNKDALEKKIESHTKAGWRLLGRGHSSEGEHSATLFRSRNN